MSTSYKVYVTPKKTPYTYGTEVEITDYVALSGIREVTRSIDSSDYNISVYTYNDLVLTVDNSFGKFSDVSDSRTMFIAGRDLAKIRVVFDNNGETITFRGLINDEATRNDVQKDEIEFRVLDRGSVIRKSKVDAGSIADGMSIRQAIYTMLNTSDITAVLTVSLSNINPDQAGTVNVGSAFNDVEKKDALDQLLLASNSVLIIDSSDNVIVRSRFHDTTNPIVNLYGRGDLLSRENIVSIKNYNSGLQRMFNVITLNDITVADAASVIDNRANKKEFTFDWLIETVNITTLANRILREWRFPKIELEVTISTTLGKSIDLLDRVSVDYPLLARPLGPRLPIVGIAIVGDPDTPLPLISGAVKISPLTGFKVIEKRESIGDFLTTLKLRQIGTSASDGTF